MFAAVSQAAGVFFDCSVSDSARCMTLDVRPRGAGVC